MILLILRLKKNQQKQKQKAHPHTVFCACLQDPEKAWKHALDLNGDVQT